nr:hypothetical protein [Tanacetum cinerariifolium]
FQENYDDEADEKSCEECLRDLELEFHERALLENSKRFIKRERTNFQVKKQIKTLNVTNVATKVILQEIFFSKTSEPSYKSSMSNSSSVSKGFQPKFTPKLIQSSPHAQSSQSEPKIQNDYKAEYNKMKAKFALLEASPSTSQSPKPFQSKNKGLVAKTFN